MSETAPQPVRMNILESEKVVNETKQVVADYFKIDVKLFHERTRKREVVLPRQVSMHLIKLLVPRMGLEKIASCFGIQPKGMDHATVLHSLRVIKNLMETQKEFSIQVNEVKNILIRKLKKKGIEVGIRKDYYIDLNNITVLKFDTEKAVVFTGIEAEKIVQIKNILFPKQPAVINDLKNTGVYLFDQKKDYIKEQNENNGNMHQSV